MPELRSIDEASMKRSFLSKGLKENFHRYIGQLRRPLARIRRRISATFSNDGRVECVAKCDFVISELTPRPKSTFSERRFANLQ